MRQRQPLGAAAQVARRSNHGRHFCRRDLVCVHRAGGERAKPAVGIQEQPFRRI
jgi:hypothetical protein